MQYDLNSMFGIKGEVAIITGAARGIGKEIALAMGKLGARLVLVGRNKESLKSVEDEFNLNGMETISVAADVTSRKDMQRMADTAVEHFGRIDILVNNAGVNHVEDTVNLDIDKWEYVMDVNVKGTLLACQAAGKYMLERKKGRIVNISSVRGFQGKAGFSAYAPSKGAVNMLTKTLAVEWAKDNVNVNAVAPIFTLTDLNRSLLDDKPTYEWVISRLPKGRLCEKAELVGAVIFLCSPCANFITGQVLCVDGGWTAG